MMVSVHAENWAAKRPFRITGKEWTSFESVVVELGRDGFIGRGEALGVYYRGDTADTMIAAVERVAPDLERGISRDALQELLPAGGARNAIDAALWDLEAKAADMSVWTLTGISPRALQTVYTIGLDHLEAMVAQAIDAAGYPLLKVKLDDQEVVDKVEAIRRVRPDARIVLDANQGWTFAQLRHYAPELHRLGVEMIEQPLPVGDDDELEGYESPVPLAADESCLTMADLDHAEARYDLINIKLDKAGGLTHALSRAKAARDRGLGLMVGCMAGSSLAMAPAFVVGCISDLVDIDGPLLQRRDRMPGMTYTRGLVDPPGPALWG